MLARCSVDATASSSFRSMPRASHSFERLVTLALVAAACAFALHVETLLPHPLDAHADLSVFSEARASAFAESLGPSPRLAGSSNELEAFERLERELRDIAKDVAARSKRRVEVDVLRTKHSGTFPLRGPGVSETREQTMVFDRLDAVSARVRVTRDHSESTEDVDVAFKRDTTAKEPIHGSTPSSSERRRRALLLAAHVDTVHVSPGGCDNAANLAIVLETFRAYAHGLALASIANASLVTPTRTGRSETDIVPLVVTFTSAEEDGFMGARGVVGDHVWFRDHVAAFVNFEAMGSGGPHRLFRATSGGSSRALLRLWSMGVSRPSGAAVASDAFNSGFIRSDTEFRIFRDDGDVPGLDLAFVERTSVYHTPRDTFSSLRARRPGSLQASGENALGFVRVFTEKSVFAEFQGGGDSIVPGGVSTTRPKGAFHGDTVSRATVASSSSVVEVVVPLTIWFAFPAARRFVVFDVAAVPFAAALFVVASTAALGTVLGDAKQTTTGNRNDARLDRNHAVHAVTALVVGVVGCFVSCAAAPVAGASAAAAAARIAETPVPWQKSLRLFLSITVPPAAAATIACLLATRSAVRALLTRRARATEPNLESTYDLETATDRAFVASSALFLACATSSLFARGFATGYLFFAPAVGASLGAWFSSPVENAHATRASSPHSPYAYLPGLLVSAVVAFPACFALADLAFGMAARSRPPAGRNENLYDIACGAVSGGAFVVVAFPTLACAVVGPRAARRTVASPEANARRLARGCVFFFSAFFFSAASVYEAARSPTYGPEAPRLDSRFVVLESLGDSETPARGSRGFETNGSSEPNVRVAYVWQPAGPGSAAEAFAETSLRANLLRSETTGSSFAAACDEGSRPETRVGEDLRNLSRDARLLRWDLASYGLEGTGACAFTSEALREEVRSVSAVSTSVSTDVGAYRISGAPSSSFRGGDEGNRATTRARAILVPITVRFHGHTRWVIAVDARCASRVAFSPGQDARSEDSAFANGEAAAGARPPVGPWRLVSNGNAGIGTGTRRYAAFGVGGFDARERPRPITVWLETVPERMESCATDAVRVRADADFETPTFSEFAKASPEWASTFAKHHTPLKLAIVKGVGLGPPERAHDETRMTKTA